MTLEEAEQMVDGLHAYVNIWDCEQAVLDGWFTVENLEAVIMLIKAKGKDSG